MVDIKSAYPFAMVHEHPTGMTRETTTSMPDSARERERCFFEITCDSDGVFPHRSDDALTFPRATGTYFVTGWELNAALETKSISNITAVTCHRFAETMNFRAFVDKWFAVKDSADAAGDTATRIIAKLLLCSLYGKFAQDPRKFSDAVIVPRDSTHSHGKCSCHQQRTTCNCWSTPPGAIFDEHEIHQRPKPVTSDTEF